MRSFNPNGNILNFKSIEKLLIMSELFLFATVEIGYN